MLNWSSLEIMLWPGGGGRRAEDVAILISIAQCQQRTILSNVSKVSKSAACVPNIWVVFDLSIKI